MKSMNSNADRGENLIPATSFRRSQAGVAAWFMVITLILAIGSVVAYIIVKARYEGMLEHQKKRADDIKDYDTKIERIRARMKTVHPPVGLTKTKGDNKEPKEEKKEPPKEGEQDKEKQAEEEEAPIKDEDIVKVIGTLSAERASFLESYFFKVVKASGISYDSVKDKIGKGKKKIRVRESAEWAELEEKRKKEEEAKKKEEDKKKAEEERKKAEEEKKNGGPAEKPPAEKPPEEKPPEEKPKEGGNEDGIVEEQDQNPPGQGKPPAQGNPPGQAQGQQPGQEEEREIYEKNIEKEVEYTFWLDALTDLPHMLYKKIIMAEELLRQAQQDRKLAEARKKGAEDRLNKIPQQYPKEAEEYIEMARRLEEEIRQLDDSYKAQKERVQNLINEIPPKIDDENKKWQEEKPKIIKNMDKLQADILTELHRSTQQIKPKQLRYLQGKIATPPDMQNRITYINLGSTDGVFSDLRFVVGRDGPMEGYVPKAEVSVTKVWPNRAEVRIEKLYSKDKPIVEGDLLLNPLWKGAEHPTPLRIVFIGLDSISIGPFPFELERRIYTFYASEAKRKLIMMGAEIQDRVDVYTDLIIMVGNEKDWEEKITDQDRKKLEKEKLERARLLGLINDVTVKDAVWAFPYLGMGEYSKVK